MSVSLSKTLDKYYSDISFDQMDYGVLIRSPIKSGTIRSITHPNLPSGYVIITAKNIPGKNSIKTNKIETPLLAYEKISYIGEPIGILVGPNLILLNELLKGIEIKYTIAQEQANSPAVACNIFSSRQVIHGESELLFTESALQVKRTYASKLQFTKSKETLGAIVSYSKNNFLVYTPTQWPSHLRQAFCDVFACEKENITINKTISDNNATNSLWYTSIIACQAALASYVTNKPIKISLSRKEQKEFIDSPIIVHTSFQVALEIDGTIRAMNTDIRINCGAFFPFADEIIDKMIIALTSIYRFKTFCITAFAQNTNDIPLSADLHLTDFLAFYTMENLMQDISTQLHIFPNELRTRNLFCKESSYPFILDNSKIVNVIDKVVFESDFLRKYVSFNLASNNSKNIFQLRGIGLSCAFEGSGYYGAAVNDTNLSMEITVEIDGKVVIKAPTPPDSIFEIWQSIISEILDVSKNNIIMNVDTESMVEPALPNISADNISILTNLVKKCCISIQKQRFRHPLPISVKRSITSNKTKKWNMKSFSGEPFYSTSWVSAVTEIEIDPSTYAPKINAIWVAIDGGEILNKIKAIQSVKKAIYQTLFFCLPGINSNDIPMHIYFIENNKDEPKEIGDLIFNVLPSSITTALSTAVHQQISVLPLAPDALYYPLEKDNIHNET